MEVNIYGRNIKVTERLEEYVNDKVQKFAQLGDNVKDIDVKFSKDGHLGGESIRVEITVVGTGPVLRSEAQGHDKFAVFDETYGKLLERLRRARDRRKLHKRGGKHRLRGGRYRLDSRGYRSNYRDSAAGCSG